MKELITEVPEVEIYCKEIITHIDRYKYYQEEQFEQLVMGIFATSNVDAHGDIFSREVLEHFVEHIKSKGMWLMYNHDPTIQPIGRIIAAKLFYGARSRTYFVAGVSAIFAQSVYHSFAQFGIDPLAINSNVLLPDNIEIEKFPVHVGASNAEIDNELMKEIMTDAPPSVSPSIESEFRKALDPFTLISFSIPIYLLLKTPFIQKYQEKLGEKAAELTIDFLVWIKNSVAKKLSSRINRRVLYQFKSVHNGCEAQFLIDSKDVEVVCIAMDQLESAVLAARTLIDNLTIVKPERVAYIFDHRQTKRWLPLYATTQGYGVICDQIQLISIEKCTGFSLSGAAHNVLYEELEVGSTKELKD